MLRPAHDGDPFLNELLAVLRAAAAQRSQAPDTRSAYLWIAEMRTDPEVAVEIGELFDTFMDSLPVSADGGAGALGFAIVPSGMAAPHGVTE